MAKVVVTLKDEALLALEQVFLDEDQAAALEFLREHVEPQIPTKGTAPCDSSRLNPFLRKGDGRKRRG